MVAQTTISDAITFVNGCISNYFRRNNICKCMMADKLASPRTRPTFAPPPPPICSARDKFVHCVRFMNAIRSGAVAASRDLRGVGRRLEGACLDTVRADSRLIINQSYIMSKRSLFWGKGSGKLGEAVYYRAGGEQRTRAYVKTVKNPKTYQLI
jgi:hypothetical protein